MNITKIENVIFPLAIISSVASFSESDTVSYYCTTVMYGLWAVELILTAVQRNLKYNRFMLWMLGVYVFWLCCSYVFSWLGIYRSSSLGVVSYLLFCTAFYLLGFNYQYDDVKIYKRLIIAFVIGQILLMATMAFHLDHAMNTETEYKPKNQMGQMLGIGIVCELVILPRYIKNFILKAACIASGASSFIVLLYIRSRTPVVAVLVVVIYMFLLRKGKKGKDYWTAVIAALALAIVIWRLGGSDFLLELFRIDQSTATQDYNHITSGRLDLIAVAWRDFLKHPFTGVGAYSYIDNFFFNVLRCGGALLIVLIIPLTYGKMLQSFRATDHVLRTVKQSKVENYHAEQYSLFLITTKVMILYYFIISLMEGYPPLGPGASLFFLWILFGMFDRMKKETLIDE